MKSNQAILHATSSEMNRYLYGSNNIPTKVLGWLSPSQKRKQLIADNPRPKPPTLAANIIAFIYGALPDLLKFLVSHH